MKLFHNGGTVKYDGARDMKSLADFVNNHVSKTVDVPPDEGDDAKVCSIDQPLLLFQTGADH